MFNNLLNQTKNPAENKLYFMQFLQFQSEVHSYYL
jgi:hypothetical protein